VQQLTFWAYPVYPPIVFSLNRQISIVIISARYSIYHASVRTSIQRFTPVLHLRALFLSNWLTFLFFSKSRIFALCCCRLSAALSKN